MPQHSRAKQWYVLGLGSLTTLVIFGVAMACMPVLFSEIAADLDLNLVQLGTVWGSSALAGIFSILLVGLIADRFGARRTLAVGCVIAGVFGGMRGLSNSFLTLAATSLLFGFASEALPVVVIKNVSQWFRDDSRHGMAQGIVAASVGAGMMLGALFSATLLSPAMGGWQNVLFLYGGLSALVGVLWFLTVPEPPVAPAFAEPSHAMGRGGLSHVIRLKGVWLIALAMLGFAGCNRGLSGYLPLYLRNAGWTPAAADSAYASMSAAGMLGAVPLTHLSDRLGLRKATLIPGMVVTAVCVGLISVVTGYGAWVLVVAIGFFRDMIWAVSATMTVEKDGVGPEYAGTAVGLVHTFSRIGYTIAPPAGNALEAFGAGLPFVFWAGMAAAALLAFILTRETGRRREYSAAYN